MRVSHIKNHIDDQLSHMEFISSAVTNLTSVGVSRISSHRIETRETALKEEWSKFSLKHDAIIIAMRQLSSHDKKSLWNLPYFKDNLFRVTQEGYLESLETMNTMLARLQKDSRSPSIHSSSQASNFPTTFNCGPRLPYLSLPTFDGSPLEWLQFKDLFDSMVVSNTNLTPVWKLHYLKQSLQGTASQLLKNTTLTNDNFQKAWDSLVSFYENKRLLVNSALHSFMTLKRMTKESSTEMENLYTNVTQIYRSLETLGRPVETWDDILVYNTVQKLDPESVKSWEHHLGSSQNPPTWQQFLKFLLNRLVTLKAFEKSRKTGFQGNQQSAKVNLVSEDKQNHCSICSSDHYVLKCPEYSGKTTEARYELIKKHKLCFNCLGQHRVTECYSTKRCLKCAKKHHTTIHRSQEQESPAILKTSEVSTSEINTQVNFAGCYHSSSPTQNRLATIQLQVISEKGEKIPARALVDPGSQISFISEKLVQQLQLPRQQSSIPLSGIGDVKAGKKRGLVHCILTPHFNSTTKYPISAYILPKLTASLSRANIDKSNLMHLKDLQLADPEFKSSGSIDILIGVDHYGQILEEGLRRGPINSLTAQATIFGWILFGPSRCSPSTFEVQSYHISIDQELYDLLQRFWTLDEMPTNHKSKISNEDQECEDHFKSTHSRDSDGRYIVRIPLKKSTSYLGESKTIALRMLSKLSKRMQSNPKFLNAYSDFLKEYEDLQHMQIAQNLIPDTSSAVYYLPHHGVIRENSTTTKLRVVFNASSRTSTGFSLNDIVHTGQKLQTELIDVLIWFRQFRYVFSSDMEKMYRQIKVHPLDWNLQRILWNGKQDKILVYQLTTVTYGIACAPFLALRVVQQLIEDEGSKFPLAVSTLTKGRYVDDVFGGADSIEETQKIVEEVNELCSAGGFPLQKWTSNDPQILENLPVEKKLFSASVPIDQQTVHTLGMNWNNFTDKFNFNWPIKKQSKTTKRSVLSIIAQLFDPLGFLSPITITAKRFIQDLWTIKLDWDDSLPSNLSEKWTEFLQHLEELPLLSFPRWFEVTSKSSIELHGFCDASQHALAAVVYIRTSEEYEQVKTAFVCSKTKVAPIKRLTIPRLELSAAVLVTKLVHHLLQVLEFDNIQVHIWTDSAIAYTWINNHPSRWKDFVHNRTCFIQESLPAAKWHFVPGKENPADLATRGLTPAELSQHPCWWIGPDWLRKSAELWPNKFESSVEKNLLEERPVPVNVVNTEILKPEWELIQKYSDLNKLIRITALCKRFILCLKKKADSISKNPLTTQELNAATYFWVRVTQQNAFSKEIKLLQKGESLPKNNDLSRLTPFIDSENLIRLGGRLQASFLSFNAKHPIILPKNSLLTQLIISNAHQRVLHGGTQQTLSSIRNEFWIIGGRVAISSFIWKCVKCFRFRKLRSQQLMGQLPTDRITPSRPFLHSGVDYAGPLLLKTWKERAARTYKAYIALFVCHSTSAIHLELVTDYSADAFIAAYKRFTARRGICATLRSHCGTNLKGADSQLRELLSSSIKQLGSISSLLAKDGTQWLFNPPAAPHFGGKWEAGVKSVKHHLRRVFGNHLLTYEEMNTFLLQIEAVLNSRPLSPLTDDPDDLSALTPGHFLIGEPLTTIPEPNLENINVARLSRWQLLRQMLESFWTRWSKECLQRYQSIYKWNQSRPSIQTGSLALVLDERYPPSKWPLARIIQVHPGKDGKIRVVTIKTQTSTFKRPITKISLLPIETNCL